MLKVWYANAHSVPSLSQHLNSVHRWTVLQLDKGTLKDSRTTLPHHSWMCMWVYIVCVCTHRNMAEKKMIENLLPWWQAQQYLIATGCWEACLLQEGGGWGWRGSEAEEQRYMEGTEHRVLLTFCTIFTFWFVFSLLYYTVHTVWCFMTKQKIK